MRISEAEPKIKKLIHEHLPTFSFKWDNSVRRFGACYGNIRLISMSKPLTKLNPWEDVKDTCLHEIAHGLAGCEHNHDKVWKAYCVQIGAKPERCYDGHIKTPKPKFVGVCPVCGNKRYTNARRNVSCGKCDPGHYNPKYKRVWSRNED